MRKCDHCGEIMDFCCPDCCDIFDGRAFDDEVIVEKKKLEMLVNRLNPCNLCCFYN